MSAVLQFEMCRKLRKAFADFERDAEQQAEQTARAVREKGLMDGYAVRHPNNEPPTEAA